MSLTKKRRRRRRRRKEANSTITRVNKPIPLGYVQLFLSFSFSRMRKNETSIERRARGNITI
jgi:hypothetical protein